MYKFLFPCLVEAHEELRPLLQPSNLSIRRILQGSIPWMRNVFFAGMVFEYNNCGSVYCTSNLSSNRYRRIIKKKKVVLLKIKKESQKRKKRDFCNKSRIDQLNKGPPVEESYWSSMFWIVKIAFGRWQIMRASKLWQWQISPNLGHSAWLSSPTFPPFRVLVL